MGNGSGQNYNLLAQFVVSFIILFPVFASSSHVNDFLSEPLFYLTGKSVCRFWCTPVCTLQV